MLEGKYLPGWLGPKRLNAEIWMTPRHMENTCLAFLHRCREAAHGTLVSKGTSRCLKPPGPAEAAGCASQRELWLSLLLKTPNSGKQGVQGSGGDAGGALPDVILFSLMDAGDGGTD